MSQAGRDRQTWECRGGRCRSNEGSGGRRLRSPPDTGPAVPPLELTWAVNALRSVRRPWAAPHTSPERNAFEEHPQGFGLDWPIK